MTQFEMQCNFLHTQTSSQSDLKMDHSFSESSIKSNSTDISTNNSGIPTAPGLTKGVRPDPEGGVSIRSRNEKTIISAEDPGEDDSVLESDPLSLSCLSVSTGQQSGPVHSDSRDSSGLSDPSPDQEDTEKITSSLIRQVIAGEKCELGGALRPLEDGLQDPFQRQNIGDDGSRNPQQNIGSFRERILSHLGSSVGDDSGCGSCFSEDAAGADGLNGELSEEGQGFLIPSNFGVVEREDEACRGESIYFVIVK